MVQHIGKLIVSTRKFIPVIYEFAETHVSITNIDLLGYQVLDTIEINGIVGVLELKAGRRVAFKIVKRIGDIFQKTILCTAQVLPDEYISLGLQQSQAPPQQDVESDDGARQRRLKRGQDSNGEET